MDKQEFHEEGVHSITLTYPLTSVYCNMLHVPRYVGLKILLSSFIFYFQASELHNSINQPASTSYFNHSRLFSG